MKMMISSGWQGVIPTIYKPNRAHRQKYNIHQRRGEKTSRGGGPIHRENLLLQCNSCVNFNKKRCLPLSYHLWSILYINLNF